MDRLRAVQRLVDNHDAVTKFAARGCGQRGNPPVNAPLSDPYAKPGMQHLEAVDAGQTALAVGLSRDPLLQMYTVRDVVLAGLMLGGCEVTQPTGRHQLRALSSRLCTVKMSMLIVLQG